MDVLRRAQWCALVIGVLACPVLGAQGQQSERDAVVKSFKEYIKGYMQSYETDERQRTEKLGGGWAKLEFRPEPDYKIDVTATNSLLSPYAGVCEFTMVRRWTDFHATKEEADKDGNLIHSSSMKHRHTYAFQDGRWVPTLRQNHESFLNKWFNCDACNVKTGEPLDDPEGCWEPDTKHPVKTCEEQSAGGG